MMSLDDFQAIMTIIANCVYQVFLLMRETVVVSNGLVDITLFDIATATIFIAIVITFINSMRPDMGGQKEKKEKKK